MNKLHKRWLAVCWLALAVSAQAQTSGDPLAALRRLVDGGQYEAAYQLAGEQASLQGNPHYDFLAGLAAVNAGHYAQGVLALERHLAAVPANDRARLELARGCYELGDYLRARREFEFVLRYNPPRDVQTSIQKYLDAMQTREVIGSRASSRSYAELGLGYDSNVNAGTTNSLMDTLGGPVPLNDPAARKTGSSFTQIMAGTQAVRRVDASLAVFAGADLDQKGNPQAAQYDTANLGLYAGFSLSRGPGLYRLTLSEAQFQLDGQKYRNTLSLTGEGQYSLEGGYLLTGVAQYAELSHANDNVVRDSRLTTLGGGVQKALPLPWRPTLGLQLTQAQEDNQHLRLDLSRSATTAKLSLAASPNERLGLSVGLSGQDNRFAQADLAVGTARVDHTQVLDLGANYLWSRNWLLRADLQLTDNASNQALYSYRRTFVGLHTRYLF
jgi:tetratricopeptide (TPR) repeat protein